MDADQHAGNPSLVEKLKTDHNFVLPSSEEVQSPETYFREVEATIRTKPQWKVHRSAALGFFNFRGYRLWLDLDPAEWPPSASPGEHPIVRDLLDQKWRGDFSPLPTAEEIGQHQIEEDLPVVLEADGTQYAALLAANRGQSIVIIGPPGSGKSQTITNLIAVSLAKGKRVLFVAQKKPALEVVLRLLGEVGMASFCLPLHSDHSKPVDVHRQLHAAGMAHGHGGTQKVKVTNGSGLGKLLNDTVAQLAAIPDGYSESTASLIQRACALRAGVKELLQEAWDESLLDVEISQSGVSSSWLEERERCLREWSSLRVDAGNTWSQWESRKLFAMDVLKVESSLRGVIETIEAALSRLRQLPDSFHSLAMNQLAKFMELIEKTPLPKPLQPQLLQFILKRGNERQRVYQLERLLKDYHRQLGIAATILTYGADDTRLTSQSILIATANLLERLKPATSVVAAKQILDELANLLDLVHDLTAQLSLYPASLNHFRSLNEGKVTFGTLRELAEIGRDSMPDLPTELNATLCVNLCNDIGLADQLFRFADQLDRARASADRVRQTFPDLMLLSKDSRSVTKSAVTALMRLGIGDTLLSEMLIVKEFVAHHIALNEQLLAGAHLPKDPISILAPTGAIGTLVALAGRGSKWTATAISPPTGLDCVVLGELVNARITPKEIEEAVELSDESTTHLRAATSILQNVTIETSEPPVARGLKILCERGAGDCVHSDLNRVAKLCRSLEVSINRATQYFSAIAKAIGHSAPETIVDFEQLGQITASLLNLPAYEPTAVLDNISSLNQAAQVHALARRCDVVRATRIELAALVSLTDVPTTNELATLRRRLRSHQGSIFRTLRGDYRSARREIQSFCRLRPSSDADTISLLDRLEAFLSEIASINAAFAGIEGLGSASEGVDTAWGNAIEVSDWAVGFFSLLPRSTVTIKRLTVIRRQAGSKLDQAPHLIDTLLTLWKSLETETLWAAVRAQGLGREENPKLHDVRAQLSKIAPLFESASASLSSLGCQGATSLSSASNAIDHLTHSRASLDKFRKLSKLLVPSGNSLDPKSLQVTSAWYQKCGEMDLPPDVLELLVDGGEDGVASLLKTVDTCARWEQSRSNLQHLLEKEQSDSQLKDHHAATQELLRWFSNAVPAISTPFPEGLTLRDLNGLLESVEDWESVTESANSWNSTVGGDASMADSAMLRETVRWGTEILSHGTPPSLLMWCVEAESGPRFLWWQRFVAMAVTAQEKLGRLLRTGAINLAEVGTDIQVDEWRHTMVVRYATLAEHIDLLSDHAKSQSTFLKDVSAAATALSHSSVLSEQLEPWEVELGVKPSTLHSDDIGKHRSWLTSIKDLPEEFPEWLLQEDRAQRYVDAIDGWTKLSALIAARQELRKLMLSFGPLTGIGPGTFDSESLSLQQLRDQLLGLLEAIPRLLPWSNLLRSEDKLKKLGLQLFTTELKRKGIEPEAVVPLFQAAVAFQQAKAAWQTDSLVSFRKQDFEDVRARFATEDRNKLEQNRTTVVRQVIGHGKGTFFTADDARAVTPEMYGILSHEENKKRKHLPIRKLIAKTAPLMQEFCPCWLMTPLAVAQFLKPGAVGFDLIIMDEASQLPPEDAWGAIARGKQVVVVGDPKQMPPTDFFSSSSSEDEAEDDSELNGARLDSILDTAKNCLRQSDLLWHYRSRHQSLIAPANRFSYGDRLILFPSSFDKHPDMGIRHMYVKDAITTTGRVVNSSEAKAVVDRLIEIALVESRKPFDKRLSVGVVAMNSPQMDCIQDLIESRRRTSQAIDKALECLEQNKAEPLLVMNLENVQGDQRDVILISYTYAPNVPGGTLNNRFGPINFEGGERRFNVLITRAKWRMEVFASMNSSEIVTAGKNPGVQHFHDFLKYAETGQLVDPGSRTRRCPDSPFEEHVIRILEEDGYQIEPQVGVAGYFIDLAVRHPKDPNRFILGIECDGATYHSSKSARDRDRLREMVLRDRGWKLYRIWSTEWFTNHEAAKEDLLVTVARTCVSEMIDC